MITIEVDQQFQDQITPLLQRLHNPAPAMRAIGAALRDSTLLRFVMQQDPYGRQWTPLSPRTIEERRKGGGVGVQILRDTGRLMNSITFNSGDDYAEIGTVVQYARDHQFGVPSRHIPIRQIFGLSNSDQTDVFSIITHYLVGDKT
jgi:phage virion morphogenesis protein